MITLTTPRRLAALAVIASLSLLAADDKMGQKDEKKDKMETSGSKKMKKKKMEGKQPMEEKKGKM